MNYIRSTSRGLGSLGKNVDSLPNEIISAILVIACDAGETIKRKCKFPLQACLISKRFHAITLWTHGLWKYIDLKAPPYDQAYVRISRSGVVPLTVDAHLPPADHQEEFERILISILPRLSDLSISPSGETDSSCLHALLQLRMPRLVTLDASPCLGDTLFPIQLAQSNFPNLKHLKSHYIIKWWDGHPQLPTSLEELHLHDNYMDDATDYIASLQTLLPPNLRSLTIGKISSTDNSQDYHFRDITIHLPSLRHLAIEDTDATAKLTLLWHLSAPLLESLFLSFDEEWYSFEGDLQGLLIPFKSLKEVQIQTGPRHPALDLMLAGCPSITRLWLITNEAHDGVREFTVKLADSPHLLPNLEQLQVYGASVFSLRQILQDRPHLTSLDIHVLDLGLTSLATQAEFTEWNEAWAGVRGSAEITLSYTRPAWGGTGFYPDSMDRYQTWDDMKRGIRMDPIDWVEIDQADKPFWISRCQEIFKRILVDLKPMRERANSEVVKAIDKMQIEVQGNLDRVLALSVL